MSNLDPNLLIDDGFFFIEHIGIWSQNDGCGFLKKRCVVSRTNPSGWDCVGSYASLHGEWLAEIGLAPDTSAMAKGIAMECSFMALGPFETRLDAITALWKGRHSASNPCKEFLHLNLGKL